MHDKGKDMEKYCDARLFEYECKIVLLHVINLFYWHEEYECMKFGYDEIHFMYFNIQEFKQFCNGRDNFGIKETSLCHFIFVWMEHKQPSKFIYRFVQGWSIG